MTKPVRMLNKYHIKEMLLHGNPQYENFYKEELIQFCKIAQEELKKLKSNQEKAIEYINKNIAIYHKQLPLIAIDYEEVINILQGGDEE